MGTGRTLRKESHVRPCKTPAGKAKKSKAQRARLVKFGMAAVDVKSMGDDLVDTARQLTQMKVNRSKYHRISLTIALLWLLWFIYEFYSSHLYLGVQAARLSVIPIIVGATIGASLGVFIYHKMQFANDEMIRQINEVTRNQ